MKNLYIKIINRTANISTVDKDEEIVHFAFRPSMKDILELLIKAPNLKVMQVSKSYNATISKSLKQLFELKGIMLSVGDVWGHRTDMAERLEVSVDSIKTMSNEEISTKEISIRTRVSETIVNYVLTQ